MMEDPDAQYLVLPRQRSGAPVQQAQAPPDPDAQYVVTPGTPPPVEPNRATSSAMGNFGQGVYQNTLGGLADLGKGLAAVHAANQRTPDDEPPVQTGWGSVLPSLAAIPKDMWSSPGGIHSFVSALGQGISDSWNNLKQAGVNFDAQKQAEQRGDVRGAVANELGGWGEVANAVPVVGSILGHPVNRAVGNVTPGAPADPNRGDPAGALGEAVGSAATAYLPGAAENTLRGAGERVFGVLGKDLATDEQARAAMMGAGNGVPVSAAVRSQNPNLAALTAGVTRGASAPVDLATMPSRAQQAMADWGGRLMDATGDVPPPGTTETGEAIQKTTAADLMARRQALQQSVQAQAAAGLNPNGQTAVDSGIAVQSSIADAIQAARKEEDENFGALRQLAAQNGTVIQGADGTLQQVPATVNIAATKAAIQRDVQQFSQSPSGTVRMLTPEQGELFSISQMPDEVPLGDAIDVRSTLNRLARGGAAGFRMGPGKVAANAIPSLHSAMEATIGELPGGMDLWEAGRQASQDKWSLNNALGPYGNASEPGAAIQRLLRSKDQSFNAVKALVEKTTDGGSQLAQSLSNEIFGHISDGEPEKAAALWDRVGTATRGLLFKNPDDISNIVQTAVDQMSPNSPEAAPLKRMQQVSQTEPVKAFERVVAPRDQNYQALQQALSSGPPGLRNQIGRTYLGELYKQAVHSGLPDGWQTVMGAWRNTGPLTKSALFDPAHIQNIDDYFTLSQMLRNTGAGGGGLGAAELPASGIAGWAGRHVVKTLMGGKLAETLGNPEGAAKIADALRTRVRLTMGRGAMLNIPNVAGHAIGGALQHSAGGNR